MIMIPPMDEWVVFYGIGAPASVRGLLLREVSGYRRIGYQSMKPILTHVVIRPITLAQWKERAGWA